jgi:hypothetical protein
MQYHAECHHDIEVLIIPAHRSLPEPSSAYCAAQFLGGFFLSRFLPEPVGDAA